MTEDLIAVKIYEILGFIHLYSIYCIDFSHIKYCMEHALLPLILCFKNKNQYNRPYK